MMSTCILDYRRTTPESVIYALYTTYCIEQADRFKTVIVLCSEKTRYAFKETTTRQCHVLAPTAKTQHLFHKNTATEVVFHVGYAKGLVVKQGQACYQISAQETLASQLKQVWKILGITPLSMAQFHRYIFKPTSISKAVAALIDQSRRVIYLHIPCHHNNQRTEVFYQEWVRQLLATDQVFLIINQPQHTPLVHHPYSYTITGPRSLADHMALINQAECVICSPGTLEYHVAFCGKGLVFFKTPAASVDALPYTRYLRVLVADIRRADQAYQAVTELLYDMDMNHQWRPAEWLRLQYVLTTPLMLCFQSSKNKEAWLEQQDWSVASASAIQAVITTHSEPSLWTVVRAIVKHQCKVCVGIISPIKRLMVLVLVRLQRPAMGISCRMEAMLTATPFSFWLDQLIQSSPRNDRS